MSLLDASVNKILISKKETLRHSFSRHSCTTNRYTRLHSCARSHIFCLSVSRDEANCYCLLSWKQSSYSVTSTTYGHPRNDILFPLYAEKNIYIDLIKITTIDIYILSLFLLFILIYVNTMIFVYLTSKTDEISTIWFTWEENLLLFMMTITLRKRERKKVVKLRFLINLHLTNENFLLVIIIILLLLYYVKKQTYTYTD